MPVPYVFLPSKAPAPARVDTARLRELLAHCSDAEAVENVTGDRAMQLDATHDDMVNDAQASRVATDARIALTRAVRADLPALLDELDAARKLIRDVLEHGLSSVEPLHARALYARLEAAGKEG